MEYKTKGILEPFNVETYYNKDTAANILAFHDLSSLKDAYMLNDIRVADCLRLIYDDGREFQFRNVGGGLYTYKKPAQNIKLHTKITNECTQLLQVVKDNEKLMSQREIDRAKAALDLQEYLGWPSIEEFLKIVRGNEARNIDIIVDNIKSAVHLYGIPSPYLRGRMRRHRPMKYDSLDHLQEPLPIELNHKRLELFMDIFNFG